MLKPVISVTHSKNEAGEHLAADDATRCALALSKRFPSHSFVVDHDALRTQGTRVIRADVSHFLPESAINEFKVFSEGFLASAHLWER